MARGGRRTLVGVVGVVLLALAGGTIAILAPGRLPPRPDTRAEWAELIDRTQPPGADAEPLWRAFTEAAASESTGERYVSAESLLYGAWDDPGQDPAKRVLDATRPHFDLARRAARAERYLDPVSPDHALDWEKADEELPRRLLTNVRPLLAEARRAAVEGDADRAGEVLSIVLRRCEQVARVPLLVAQSVAASGRLLALREAAFLAVHDATEPAVVRAIIDAVEAAPFGYASAEALREGERIYVEAWSWRWKSELNAMSVREIAASVWDSTPWGAQSENPPLWRQRFVSRDDVLEAFEDAWAWNERVLATPLEEPAPLLAQAPTFDLGTPLDGDASGVYSARKFMIEAAVMRHATHAAAHAALDRLERGRAAPTLEAAVPAPYRVSPLLEAPHEYGASDEPPGFTLRVPDVPDRVAELYGFEGALTLSGVPMPRSTLSGRSLVEPRPALDPVSFPWLQDDEGGGD